MNFFDECQIYVTGFIWMYGNNIEKTFYLQINI